METTTILLIAIPVLVVLAGIVLLAVRPTPRHRRGHRRFSAARRCSAIVAAPCRAVTEVEEAPATGKELERAAVLARAGGGAVVEPRGRLRRSPGCRPTKRRSASPGASSSTASIVGFFGLGLTGFGVACIAFLWPQLGRRLRVEDPGGQDLRHRGKIDEGVGFAYYPEGRMWITRYPAVSPGQGPGGLHRP